MTGVNHIINLSGVSSDKVDELREYAKDLNIFQIRYALIKANIKILKSKIESASTEGIAESHQRRIASFEEILEKLKPFTL